MANEKLLNHVTARLSDEELSEATLAAQRLGVSKSELLRQGLKKITRHALRANR